MNCMFISRHHNAGQNHNIKPLSPCIRDVIGSNPGQDTDILTEGFRGFLSLFWQMPGQYIEIGHNCFLL
jgi:hypothetical protein